MVVRYILQPISEAPVGATGPIPPELARKAPKGFRYVIAPAQPPPEATPATLDELKAAAVEAVRARRWIAENAGITVGGISIRTDERTQAKVTGGLELFRQNEALSSLDWEAQPGVFVTLDQPTLATVGIAVGMHVQACFSHSKALSEQVAAAADAEGLAAIDLEAGWPG